MGLVSAVGDTFEASVAARLEGRIPAEPYELDVRRYLQQKGVRHLSRSSQLACAAASRVAPGLAGVPGDEIGIVLGTARASIDTIVSFERRACIDGTRFVDPGLFAESVANVPAGHVSIFFGWSALNTTIATGTTSGISAVLEALSALEDRRARAIVAGGADERNVHALRALEAGGRGRGIPGSEAACLLVLESHAQAEERGAARLGRILGGFHHWIEPDRNETDAARAEALSDLLRSAELEPRDVDLLVVCEDDGTGDEREPSAMRGVAPVLGQHAPRVLRPKTVLGEVGAAAGPLGIVAALGALARGACRAALVLDCAETGHLAAVLVGGGAPR